MAKGSRGIPGRWDALKQMARVPPQSLRLPASTRGATIMYSIQRERRAGLIEAQRVDGFFDAAFAFVVSVLAIAGTEVPHDLHEMLLALDRIPAFACSFATLLI